MNKLIYVSILSGLVACQPNNNDAPSASGFDASMIGRWDGMVRGENGHPIWFEVVDEGPTLGGRLQPRGGHALAFDHVEAVGQVLTMRVGGASYEGSLEGSAWVGTGERDGDRFEWTAVRAPELPAPANLEWGEPIELFNGADLSGWTALAGGDSRWRAVDGALVNEESGANLRTDATFSDFKLHVEVNVPEGSNSGIYLRGRHEVQVQDDHGKEPNSRFMGGLYGQITPTSNPALPSGEWQTFEITLLGRWVSVELNGETIIDHQEIPGITGGALDSNEGEPGPIYLQGDHGRVLYRNIVLTPTVS